MARPFEGIRIIDITHVLAGPFAAYQLGLMGADVIKVEHPDDPDQSRDSGSDNALNHANMGTGFLTQASNKRAITLNLKTEQGREILKELVATADVLVENYRPGAFEAQWVVIHAHQLERHAARSQHARQRLQVDPVSTSGIENSSAALLAFTLPPYKMRVAPAILASRTPIRARMAAWTSWACSGVAVRPVPIAQTGS